MTMDATTPTSTSTTQAILELAQRYIPGGVSSANRLVDPNLVFTRSQGAYLFDAEGKRYIDYHAAFGPLLLGHSHPLVNQRAAEAVMQLDGVGIGSNEQEARLAEKICSYVPSAEKVLFCNSGSEATYAALRLARAVTGRNKIIKFQGCYHGWHDAVLMNVISPAEKIGQKDPLSAGMLPETIENTIVLPFNDLEAVRQTLVQNGEEIAAIILELIPHNIGCVLPQLAFVQGLRDLSTHYGSILIFDEVITGFRHGLGGYQKVLGVTPDLTTLAKAIANGYPLAALAGRADLLDHCRPGGDVFFAGTFNAHPMSIAAALTTIEILEQPDSYPHLFRLGERMREGLREIIQRRGINATVAGFGSIFVTYFMEPPVETYTDLLRNDATKFVNYRRQLIERGIYKLPVNLKRNHISLAHTTADIDQTLEAVDQVLR
ncbi:aspartate aminotransferase family protein [Tengunoibacter tsumagoiensis]|uniref:glutamate-1-semialdehyde 2,1-aminomutase n=1 Tax=Tengunoibacter tsumagoiensis TaxID=2014871 RepID=A0A402AA86_9CHLR|nr:glutamate-1-semialdehyde 2,1-aminomutase [Tengunoibacter tsumagoiensis]GCE16084.1 glutamate-1-semialdehyde 2,1-aminomutase [Tengunoibacter tsumagoiensis]